MPTCQSLIMAIPASKEDLLTAIDQRFAKLDAALDAVPVDLADDTSMDGHARGTMMSVNNLVSYLIGWNELVLKWLARDDAGKDVAFPETGYQWNELGALARKFYADFAEHSFEENRQRLRNVKEQLIRDIASRSNEELYGAPWYGKWTKGRMIQLNSSSPYENARGRVRKWLKAEGLLTPRT